MRIAWLAEAITTLRVSLVHEVCGSSQTPLYCKAQSCANLTMSGHQPILFVPQLRPFIFFSPRCPCGSPHTEE
jgi:hypothetical protein